MQTPKRLPSTRTQSDTKLNILHAGCTSSTVTSYALLLIAQNVTSRTALNNLADLNVSSNSHTKQTATFLHILGSNQLEALLHVFIYLIALHVSSITVLIIRRSNCINTSSGMISLCDCLVCRSGGNCSSLLTGIPSSHTD